MNVTKLVTCEDNTANGVAAIDPCAALEQLITENQFLIKVTDDNPVPSQFPGSATGTVVTLGAGSYTVTETRPASIGQAITTLLAQLPAGTAIAPSISFTGACTQIGPDLPNVFSATGTIGAGESQTCNIENSFTIEVFV